VETLHKIRVLIVDDHEMVRQSLKALLQTFDDLEVVGDTGDARTVLRLCTDIAPDVILMDLLMPMMNGIEATHLIHQQFPCIPVVALSCSADEKLVVAAFHAGVVSYILKTGSIDEVVRAVRLAYNDKPALSSQIMHILIAHAHNPQEIGADLSERERAILALMATGLNNPEIAAQLCISPSTVKNHVSSILSKLNAHTRTKAVGVAILNRLIEEPDTVYSG